MVVNGSRQRPLVLFSYKLLGTTFSIFFSNILKVLPPGYLLKWLSFEWIRLSWGDIFYFSSFWHCATQQKCCERKLCRRALDVLLCLFVHFIEWENLPAAGGHFRHLLHLMLLGTVVIFWLNDAWKWISIICDQKRYVMVVQIMHYKQPDCLEKWKYHTGLCTWETGKDSFRLCILCNISTRRFKSSVLLCPIRPIPPLKHRCLFSHRKTWGFKLGCSHRSYL